MDLTDYQEATTYIDEKPNLVKIKKTINLGNEWQEVVFIQCKKTEPATEWLKEKYPNHGYLKDWWTTYNHVIMNEKVYIHWKLCE
jgi:hypothetical protein